MEELQLTLTTQRIDQRNYGVMLSNWRVGQMLNALVVDTRPNGGVLLSVAGKQFVATTDLPVQAGTRMTLEVKQLGQEVVLRQVQDAAMQRADASARAAETTVALSSSRPAALLAQLAAQPGRFGSPDLQEVARELLGRALRGESMRPGDIRKALRQSGLFTEADLAAGDNKQAQQSTKTSLSQLQAMALALAEEADETSAEWRVLRQLADKAGGLLNGIANNQLASLPSEEGGSRWVFTLPVQLRDQFHDVRMEIEREPNSAEDEEDTWRARLSVDLPALGAVDIRVQMVKGAISVNFHCDSDRSSRVLSGAMNRLEQRLVQRELRVDRLTAEADATEVADVLPRPSSGNLDVEA